MRPCFVILGALLAAGCSMVDNEETLSPPQPRPSKKGAASAPAHIHAASHPAGHPTRAGTHNQETGFHLEFKGAEEWAKRFDDPARDTWQKPDHVVNLLGLRPGTTVADVGAGTGYFLARLSQKVGPTGQVLALDVEPDMVRYMTERAKKEGLANTTIRKVAPDDPALPPGGLDKVLIVNTWHHIGGRSAYAQKLSASLIAGGEVFIIDFTLDSPEGPPKHHRLPPERVMKELQAGGLEPRVLKEDLPYQYVIVGRKN